MSTVLSNKIVQGFRSIQYSNDNNKTNIDKVFLSLSISLHDYITNEYIISSVTNGNVTSPGPVVTPITESVSVSINFGTQETLQDVLKGVINNGQSTGFVTNFFNAIDDWLVLNPITISLSPIGPLLSSIVGTGLLTFPSITLQITNTINNIQSVEFSNDYLESMEQIWNIISINLFNGLSSYVLPSIPTTGFSNSLGGTYIGMTDIILSYK